MQFDPVSWGTGFGLTKILNKIIEIFSGSELSKSLQKEVKAWTKTLPDKYQIRPDVFFSLPSKESVEARDLPKLSVLQETICKKLIPSQDRWLDALIEYREERRRSLTEQDTHPFLKVDYSEIGIYLEDLSCRFHKVFAENQSYFNTAVIKSLNEQSEELKSLRKDRAGLCNIEMESIKIFFIEIEKEMYQLGLVCRILNRSESAHTIDRITFEGNAFDLIGRGECWFKQAYLREEKITGEVIHNRFLKPQIETTFQIFLPVKFEITVEHPPIFEVIFWGKWSIHLENDSIVTHPKFYGNFDDGVAIEQWKNILNDSSSINLQTIELKVAPKFFDVPTNYKNYLLFNSDRSEKINIYGFANTNAVKNENGTMVWVRGPAVPQLVNGWEILGSNYPEVWDSPRISEIYNSIFPPDKNDNPKPFASFANCFEEMGLIGYSAPTTAGGTIFRFIGFKDRAPKDLSKPIDFFYLEPTRKTLFFKGENTRNKQPGKLDKYTSHGMYSVDKYKFLYKKLGLEKYVQQTIIEGRRSNFLKEGELERNYRLSPPKLEFEKSVIPKGFDKLSIELNSGDNLQLYFRGKVNPDSDCTDYCFSFVVQDQNKSLSENFKAICGIKTEFEKISKPVSLREYEVVHNLKSFGVEGVFRPYISHSFSKKTSRIDSWVEFENNTKRTVSLILAFPVLEDGLFVSTPIDMGQNRSTEYYSFAPSDHSFKYTEDQGTYSLAFIPLWSENQLTHGKNPCFFYWLTDERENGIKIFADSKDNGKLKILVANNGQIHIISSEITPIYGTVYSIDFRYKENMASVVINGNYESEECEINGFQEFSNLASTFYIGGSPESEGVSCFSVLKYFSISQNYHDTDFIKANLFYHDPITYCDFKNQYDLFLKEGFQFGCTTKDEILDTIQQYLNSLKRYCILYDKGIIEKAKEIANIIRSLIVLTPHGPSLLKQFTEKNLSLCSSIGDGKEDDKLAFMMGGLFMISNKKSPEPICYKFPDFKYDLISIKTWVNQAIAVYDDKISRKDICDFILNGHYTENENSSIAEKINIDGYKRTIPTKNIQYVMVRQMAEEILQSEELFETINSYSLRKI